MSVIIQKPNPYETSPIKRNRRTRQQMDAVLFAIQKILAGEQDHQITIRHLFYRLVGLNVIEKTESAYKNLCSHLSKWRRSQDIAWGAFTDNTRWHIRGRAFNNMEEALRITAETYRRNLWGNQPYYIEVWVEKDAIASIVAGVANSFGVPVFVCRGFASLSSLYDAANTFREAANAGKKLIIYHLGDFDPSGIKAGESALKAFRDDFNIEMQFIRAAVTKEQIAQLQLPTRPTKNSCHSRGWTGGGSVELDAMPPSAIKDLVKQCITQHIDAHAWNTMRQIEAQERETMRQLFKKAA